MTIFKYCETDGKSTVTCSAGGRLAFGRRFLVPVTIQDDMWEAAMCLSDADRAGYLS